MKAKLIKTKKQYILSANDADLHKFESAIDTDNYGWVIADEYGGDILKLSKQNCAEIFLELYDTEIEVEIKMKKVVDKTKVIGALKGVKGSGHKITTYKTVPKIDSKGCLILKCIV
jgi:hypothetical protein